MAFNMASCSRKVTKPNPLDLPVSRSEMTLLDVTSPNGLKASSRRLSVVAHARPPTKHLCSSPIFLNTKNRQYFGSAVYELQDKTFKSQKFGKTQQAAPRLAARTYQRTCFLPASGSGYKEQPSSPRPKTAGSSIYTSVYKEKALSRPKAAGSSIYSSVYKEQDLTTYDHWILHLHIGIKRASSLTT
jgi:hypothetical protein